MKRTSPYVGAISPQRPTTLLDERRKNVSGLLDLKLKARVDNHVPTRASGNIKAPGHRRQTSIRRLPLPVTHTVPKPLKLTIKSATDDFVHENFIETFVKNRGMEYLHRNIFLGITSLNTFLDHLEADFICKCKQKPKLLLTEHQVCYCPITVTRHNIIQAFSTLAEKEQTLVRSMSPNREGWDLVHPIELTDDDVDITALTRIQLGSITLGEFLESLGLVEREVPTAIKYVVKAFERACRIDMMRQRNRGSKAEAYRRRMLLRGGERARNTSSNLGKTADHKEGEERLKDSEVD